MLTAWDFKREEPSRGFAECLRSAWALSKAIAKRAAQIAARMARGVKTFRLSPSLGRSPIQRATALEPYARVVDRRASYTTSIFGA